MELASRVIRMVPVINGDRVIGELSRRNELPNVFLKKSRSLENLHENILQVGQHICYSVGLSSISSCRAAAIPGANSLDR